MAEKPSSQTQSNWDAVRQAQAAEGESDTRRCWRQSRRRTASDDHTGHSGLDGLVARHNQPDRHREDHQHEVSRVPEDTAQPAARGAKATTPRLQSMPPIKRLQAEMDRAIPPLPWRARVTVSVRHHGRRLSPGEFAEIGKYGRVFTSPDTPRRAKNQRRLRRQAEGKGHRSAAQRR